MKCLSPKYRNPLPPGREKRHPLNSRPPSRSEAWRLPRGCTARRTAAAPVDPWKTPPPTARPVGTRMRRLAASHFSSSEPQRSAKNTPPFPAERHPNSTQYGCVQNAVRWAHRTAWCECENRAFGEAAAGRGVDTGRVNYLSRGGVPNMRPAMAPPPIRKWISQCFAADMLVVRQHAHCPLPCVHGCAWCERRGEPRV